MAPSEQEEWEGELFPKSFICILEFKNKNCVDTALGRLGIMRKLNSVSTLLSDLASWHPLPIKTILVCALLF